MGAEPDEATIDFVLSSRGRQALALLAERDLGEAQSMSLLAELRRRFAPEQAGALLTLARLRQKAAGKFPHADRLFFTAEALEQATAFPIACHRAEWIHRHAPPRSHPGSGVRNRRGYAGTGPLPACDCL